MAVALIPCWGSGLGQRAGSAIQGFSAAEPGQNSAVLTGTVADATGAVLPDAGVHVAGKAGKADTKTDGEGRFTFHLPPGSYVLQVGRIDFVPYTSGSLSLRANGPVRLSIRLAVAGQAETVQAEGGMSDGHGFGGTQVFEGKTLDLLSDDDETMMRQLRALTGGGLGGGGLQILVNGFTGNQMPPKSSIRSIKINSNEYSAYYDSPGFGRIEVQTKPGADKLHGALDFQGTDQPLNARNPYEGTQVPGSPFLQVPYYQFLTDGNLNGPLGKKTSYFVSEQVQRFANNVAVNAINPAAITQQVSEAYPAPQTTQTYSLRLDRQFSPNNFAYVRDQWSQTHITNGGIDPLVLPSAAYALNTLTNTVQMADTQILSARVMNETRFQYLRTRLRQDPNSTAPALVAEGSFTAGGSSTQELHDNQDLYELQDEFEMEHGSHSIRTGFRFRDRRDANVSTANFNGQFIFPSLDAYRITQTGLAAGLTAAQIRAAGGGASQFNLTAGQPSAVVSTADFAAYAEDSWKFRPDLSVSYGIRLESQSAIPDHFNPAPRVSLSWSPRRHHATEPFLSVDAGYGIFYDRFAVTNLLQAVRQNGVAETAYFVQNPDFYPNLPGPALLTAAEPTTYQVSPRLHTSYQQLGGVLLERSVGRHGQLQGRYLYSHGTHGYLSRNINAPLPGTYNPAYPASSQRPFGSSANIYEYSSDSNANSHQLNVGGSGDIGKVYFYGNYAWEHTYNETTYDSATGATRFPSDQYNLRSDYGRAADSNKHRIEAGAIWTLPHGFSLQPYLDAHSGNPFDITTGTDLNGDTIYNDRPAFATDLSRASVVRTALGNFDTAPQPGQTITPRNYGTDPNYVIFILGTRYTVHIGPKPAETPGQAGRHDRPYTLRFKLDAENVFNHNNPGPPVGVLSSPFFGRSLSLANDFSTFSASNRTLLLQAFFTF